MCTGHDLPDAVKPLAENITHWGFGAITGAVYSVIAEKVVLARLGYGSAFGVAFWIGLHELFLPLMKCSAWPNGMTAREQGNEFVSHIIYGMGVEGTRRYVRKRLG